MGKPGSTLHGLPSSPVSYIPAYSGASEIVISPYDKISRTPHPQELQQGCEQRLARYRGLWRHQRRIPSLCPLQSWRERAQTPALNLLLICTAGPGTNPFPLGLFVRAHTLRRVVSPHLCNFSGDQTLKMRLQAFQTTSPTVNKG